MAGVHQGQPTPALVALAALIEERLEECADRALRRIYEAEPELAHPGVLPREEQRAQALHTLGVSITLLAAESALSKADLAWCHQLGQRRAQQGIPLDRVVRSLHITELVLWELLSDLAGDVDGACPTDLLGRAATIWTALDEMANAAGEGHRLAGQRFDVEHRRNALALVSLLREDPTSEHAEEIARSLGLDPAGAFVAAVHEGAPTGAGLALPAVMVEELERTVLVVQQAAGEVSGEGLVAVALEADGRRAGVGLSRERLTGAGLSLLDAEMAFEAAVVTGTPVVRFRQEWLNVLAINHRAEYEDLVAEAVARIRVAADTTATVAAFLDHVGSLSAAGRALKLHANTVAYRLRQFAERTGVDPRTAAGAALTQLALALARAEPDVALPDTPLAAG